MPALVRQRITSSLRRRLNISRANLERRKERLKISSKKRETSLKVSSKRLESCMRQKFSKRNKPSNCRISSRRQNSSKSSSLTLSERNKSRRRVFNEISTLVSQKLQAKVLLIKMNVKKRSSDSLKSPRLECWRRHNARQRLRCARRSRLSRLPSSVNSRNERSS